MNLPVKIVGVILRYLQPYQRNREYIVLNVGEEDYRNLLAPFMWGVRFPIEVRGPVPHVMEAVQHAAIPAKRDRGNREQVGWNKISRRTLYG